MTPTPSLSRLLTEALFAFCVATLILALLYPGQSGVDLGTLFLFSFVTNAPLFALGVLAAALLRRVTGKAFPALGLMIGLGVPLSAMAGTLWFLKSGHAKAMLEGGGVVLFLFGLAGLLWRPKFALPNKICVAGSLVGLLGAALLLAGVGRQEVPGIADDMIPRAALPGEEPLAEATTLPDVVLISIDTLRADAVLFEDVATPNLDRLREGSRWSPYGLAATPSTLPSHITMMTGESPFKHGTYTNLGILTPEPDTLASVFAEAGYRTAGTAANGLLSPQNGFARGFESLINVGTGKDGSENLKQLGTSSRRNNWISAFASDRFCMSLTTMIIDRRWALKEEWKSLSALALAPKVEMVASEHLRQLHEGARPYFYFLHFMAPHAPYDALPPFRGQLSRDLPIPEYLKGISLDSNDLTHIVGRNLRAGHPQAQQGLDLARARYHEELMMVDDALGRLFGQIEATGRPTIMLFTSDHGEAFGENQFMRHGNNVFAPAIRIPFMLTGPGIEPGQFTVTPRLADIPLTLLRAAGLPVKSFQEGRDLLAQESLSKTPFFAVHENRFAVYHDGYKMTFIWNANDGPASALEPLNLFRIEEGEAGLREEENLLDRPDMAEVMARLTKLAEGARDGSTPTVRREFSKQDLLKLAELGYAFTDEGNAVDD